jgi:hypothetical protein
MDISPCAYPYGLMPRTEQGAALPEHDFLGARVAKVWTSGDKTLITNLQESG